MKLITEALLEAQKEIEAVDKDGKNPFFKSSYTTLNAAIMACKQILNKHDIVVLQPIQSDENGVYVATTLIHTSGEQITSKHRIREAKDNDPQSQGSAITYARRYSLMSMLCMSSDDDDGEKAQQAYRKEPVRQAVRQTAPQQDGDLWCDYHDVKMFQTPKMKNPAHRDDERGWCNGKGYPEEMKNWREKVKTDKVRQEEPPMPEESGEDVADSVPF